MTKKQLERRLEKLEAENERLKEMVGNLISMMSKEPSNIPVFVPYVIQPSPTIVPHQPFDPNYPIITCKSDTLQ